MKRREWLTGFLLAPLLKVLPNRLHPRWLYKPQLQPVEKLACFAPLDPDLYKKLVDYAYSRPGKARGMIDYYTVE